MNNFIHNLCTYCRGEILIIVGTDSHQQKRQLKIFRNASEDTSKIPCWYIFVWNVFLFDC